MIQRRPTRAARFAAAALLSAGLSPSPVVAEPVTPPAVEEAPPPAPGEAAKAPDGAVAREPAPSGETPRKADRDDPFVRRVQASGKKWVVLTGPEGQPELVLDADGFLRAVFFDEPGFDAYRYCHRPVVIRDPKRTLDEVILKMRLTQPGIADEVIDKDLVLLWADERRVVTGADILGRLLEGIAPAVQPVH